MKWEILHIPGELPNSFEQSTVDVLASAIEPRLASVLVRKLNQIYPLEDIRHVKRVRRRSVEGNTELSVILCLSSGHDDPMVDLSEDLLQLVNIYQLKPFKTEVAKFAATSKEEWEEQCKHWPTSYHLPKNLIGIVGFSDDDSQLIFNYMKVAIRLTKLSCRVGKVVNAAVIVDPLSRQIIATASDETYRLPSSVSAMKAECANCNGSSTSISLRSNADGLVHDSKDSAIKLSPNECSESYSEVSCLHPWGWMTSMPHNENTLVKCSSNNLWHPLRHAALVAIEKAAARDRWLFPRSGTLKDESYTKDSLHNPSNSSPAKRQKTNALEADDILFNGEHANELSSEASFELLRPYLCTGFDMYLVWEPCTMCAMGLVHQRIRRIFYAFPNRNAGALGSVYRLHGEKSLNHHYSVFRILLPEKALHEVELDGLDI